MIDEQALAHQIIKQALHDPANVMMLGEVKPLADAYVAQEARARKLVEALDWAVPLAVIALEDHRLLRLKHGHTDAQFQFITANGTRMVGLAQDEYDKLTKARAALAEGRGK